jgi:hypothetical protein
MRPTEGIRFQERVQGLQASVCPHPLLLSVFFCRMTKNYVGRKQPEPFAASPHIKGRVLVFLGLLLLEVREGTKIDDGCVWGGKGETDGFSAPSGNGIFTFIVSNECMTDVGFVPFNRLTPPCLSCFHPQGLSRSQDGASHVCSA